MIFQNSNRVASCCYFEYKNNSKQAAYFEFHCFEAHVSYVSQRLKGTNKQKQFVPQRNGLMHRPLPNTNRKRKFSAKSLRNELIYSVATHFRFE